MGVWLGATYGWITITSSIRLYSNYVFFSSAAAQLILFSFVIGYTIKKKGGQKFRLEQQQKLLFEQRVKERTAELEQANEQLSLKNKELEKINGTKNRLLTILSHDLRSPIHNVASLISLIKEHHIDQKGFSALLPELEKSISDTTNFMSLLISWTQSQRDGLVANKSPFRIREVIEKNVSHFKAELKAKALDLEVFVDTEYGYADENMMELVIRNLLSNAIKFSLQAGKIIINVTEPVDNLVAISITDQGVGIDEQRLDLFFDVSRKNTTPGTHGEKGFGMGLILCKDFAMLNDGKLTFTSEKGKGSTFTVTIPSTTAA